jgi:uncharacterized repeat protein (TIGR04138 family)
MQPRDVDQVLEEIVRKDPRYKREAYLLVREALDYTQTTISKQERRPIRHVTGQELLGGFRAYVLQQFGPLALTVLHEWGIYRCEDVGEIVFNLVEAGLLACTPTDSREDFRGGYDFEEAFNKPFLPSKKLVSPPGQVPESQPH